MPGGSSMNSRCSQPSNSAQRTRAEARPVAAQAQCHCGKAGSAGGYCDSCNSAQTSAPTPPRSAEVGDFSHVPPFAARPAPGTSVSGARAWLARPGDQAAASPATAKEAPQAEAGATTNGQCFVSGSFTKIPSGVLKPKFSGSEFSAPFDMQARFTPLKPGCDCHCGEYRQFVRGSISRSSKPGANKALCGGKPIDPDQLQEDCDEEIPGFKFRYGHRADRIAGQFRPDFNGCEFVAHDAPGYDGLHSGETADLRLYFYGALVDTCLGGKVLAEASWQVIGSGTMP